jgi:alkylmercury lyase
MTIEIRPGVQRPDWSAVTTAAVRDALQARHHSRPGPVEAWSVTLRPSQDLAYDVRIGRTDGSTATLA